MNCGVCMSYSNLINFELRIKIMHVGPPSMWNMQL